MSEHDEQSQQPSTSPTADTPTQRDAKASEIEAQRLVTAQELEERAHVEARIVKAVIGAQIARLRWEMRVLCGLTVFLSACSLLAVLVHHV